MTIILDDRSVDSVFRSARRCHLWLDKPVGDAIIEAIWELAKLPPTATGAYPARIVFAKSGEAKALLAPALEPGDAASTLAAPVSAVIGHDPSFLGDAKRDATLQAAYLILAARALGLDCTPLAPRDPARLDKEFFADGAAKSIFVCNFGYGDPAGSDARQTGPSFETMCRIV